MSLLKGKKNKKVDQDLHRLVGQILNDRLRVLKLSFVSPRQWLYEVEPPSVGKTRRALKVLGHPEGREPGSFYRLRTFCDRIKQSTSVYLESVYETGLLHDLTPYILTQWLPYPSLYEHLRQRQVQKKGALSWEEARPLLVHVMQALQALHQLGLTHGDLRPQHILLKNETHPILIDYGVSSAFGAPPAPGLDRSIAYWAPERLTFASSTPSTDFYSFGILLYTCLHGRPPFNESNSSNEILDPTQSVIDQHQNRPPPPLSVEVPSEIDHLYLKLLAKEPHQRPATAQEIIDILDPSIELSTSVESPPLSLVPESKQSNLTTSEFSLIETAPSPYSTTSSYSQESDQEDEEALLVKSTRSTPSSLSFMFIVLLSISSVILGIGLAYLI